MTFEEFVPSTSENMFSLDQLLVETLEAGKEEHRLVLGIVNCAHILETDPDSVFICITPEDRSSDPTLKIYYTLIDAFCFENNVPYVKVDECVKLYEVLRDCKVRSKGAKKLNEVRQLKLEDCYCVLVKLPADEYDASNVIESKLMDKLVEYDDGSSPTPVVVLPPR